MPIEWTAMALMCTAVGLLIARAIVRGADGVDEPGPGQMSAGPVVVTPPARGRREARAPRGPMGLRRDRAHGRADATRRD